MTITDSEWKIMELLWEKEPMTITQMTKELQAPTGWTKHTIISFLKRMEEKDIVFYEDTGKAKQYYTLVSRRDAVQDLVQEFIEKAAKGNAVSALKIFIEVCSLSEEEIQEVQSSLLERKTTEEELEPMYFDFDI